MLRGLLNRYGLNRYGLNRYGFGVTTAVVLQGWLVRWSVGRLVKWSGGWLVGWLVVLSLLSLSLSFSLSLFSLSLLSLFLSFISGCVGGVKTGNTCLPLSDGH